MNLLFVTQGLAADLHFYLLHLPVLLEFHKSGFIKKHEYE